MHILPGPGPLVSRVGPARAPSATSSMALSFTADSVEIRGMASSPLGSPSSFAQPKSSEAVSVHMVSSPDSPELRSLVDSFPPNAVLRIINEHFVETALRTGTDKGDVESRDFRRATGKAGYDVWGVESDLAQMGLTKADVFCGTPKDFFFDDKGYGTSGLGLPVDRSAILVFDGAQVSPIGETDGYRFNNPADKKSALLGVIRFPKKLRPFEREMEAAPELSDKVSILEREVNHGLQQLSDVRDRGDLLSVLVINALHDAPEGAEFVRLQKLARELDARTFGIVNWAELRGQLDGASSVPSRETPAAQARRKRLPDFVARSAREFLDANPDIPADLQQRFHQLMADAEKLRDQTPAISSSPLGRWQLAPAQKS